jgi:hypothetical protein
MLKEQGNQLLVGGHQVPVKCWYTSATLHCITWQKTVTVFPGPCATLAHKMHTDF